MPFNPFTILTSKIFGALALVFALGFASQTVRIEGFWFVPGFKQQVATLRIDLSRVRDLRGQERANHRQTKDNYRAAQFQAARLEAARLARVAAQQQEITDDISHDYQRRLAAARARYDSLRRAGGQPRAGAAGAPCGEPVPGLPTAGGGAAAASEDCGFPLEQRLVATEQAEQLDALIGWVERQAGVDPNGP